MSERVLIVDDDEAVSKMLYKVIISNSLEADIAASGEEALAHLTSGSPNYALMLLDINLGGIDGFEVIREVRKGGMKLPIIVVSGRREDYDTLYGLDIGADDYITKPFNPVILGAKVKALIRRSHGSLAENEMITAGPFYYDSVTLRLFKNGAEIPLTARENAMMKLFLSNVNRIYPKEVLYDMVWGDALVDENAVMVYINRLRQKIEDDPQSPKYIRNVRGIGYRFVV